jgi:hypothetical protein
MTSSGEVSDCCCHDGSSCHCGNKTESLEARLEKSLHRPTHPVKSKPRLTTSTSESKLTVSTNGHPTPVHRNNNLAHTSGRPYPSPRAHTRPHTLHGTSAFAKSSMDNEKLEFLRSVDDMSLLHNQGKIYSLSTSGSNSVESLDPNFDNDFSNADQISYDFDKHFRVQSGSHRNVSSEDGTSFLGQSPVVGVNWMESSLSTSATAESVFQMGTSPNFSGDYDWSAAFIPPADFSPSDLPLVSPHFSVFDQTLSHSGESSYQSAPGLTAESSGASETDFGVESHWNDTIQVRDTTFNGSWESGVESFFETNSAPVRKLHQTTIFGTSAPATTTNAQGRHMSGSSTGTAIHLDTSDIDTEDSSEHAIMIPVSEESTNSFSWSMNPGLPPHSGDQAREYGWLLDTCSWSS